MALLGCDTGKHHDSPGVGADGVSADGYIALHYDPTLKQLLTTQEKALWVEWAQVVSDITQATTGLPPSVVDVHLFTNEAGVVRHYLGPDGPGLFSGIGFWRWQGQYLGGSFDRFAYRWKGHIYVSQGPRQQCDGFGAHLASHEWLAKHSASDDQLHKRPEWGGFQGWDQAYSARMYTLWASR